MHLSHTLCSLASWRSRTGSLTRNCLSEVVTYSSVMLWLLLHTYIYQVSYTRWLLYTNMQGNTHARANFLDGFLDYAENADSERPAYGKLSTTYIPVFPNSSYPACVPPSVSRISRRNFFPRGVYVACYTGLCNAVGYRLHFAVSSITA